MIKNGEKILKICIARAWFGQGLHAGLPGPALTNTRKIGVAKISKAARIRKAGR
jgi:hypothetical protein